LRGPRRVPVEPMPLTAAVTRLTRRPPGGETDSSTTYRQNSVSVPAGSSRFHYESQSWVQSSGRVGGACEPVTWPWRRSFSLSSALWPATMADACGGVAPMRAHGSELMNRIATRRTALAIKKSDLYSSLWKSCDELRGGMDASQYKDYILVLLFVKYVSDKAKSDPDSLISVPDGGSFEDMVTLVGDPEIGDKINKIVAALARENDLEKVIDLADFNDPDKLGKGKEMQDRLSRLVRIFQSLDFRGSRAGGDDLLGDAYEYLMRHFATESGKSKGQFYTPAEVSRILAKVVGAGSSTSLGQSAYDPTCGSGSLLLKVADESPHGLTLFGQEKDNATRALSVMNMVLHDNETADIRDGDTITSPKFLDGNGLKTFDYVVSNPPFSIKSWSNGLDNEYSRFEYGRPPEKNGDYAFLLHVLKSMKTTGKAAVILPHGVLFRGNAEAGIRRQLLQRGFIKGVIGLPANLFYGTGIPACILVLDKENAQARKGVFMIDASQGFIKDGPKNRLRSQDIHKIVDVFTKQTEAARYSRLVPLDEIADAKNEFNLNIPRYIDSSQPEDVQDLHAHLHGGIPRSAVPAEPPRILRPQVGSERRRASHSRLPRVPEVRRRDRHCRTGVVCRPSQGAGCHRRRHRAKRSDRHHWRRPALAVQAGRIAR
jgi:type I restriction enzyme M protein